MPDKKLDAFSMKINAMCLMEKCMYIYYLSIFSFKCQFVKTLPNFLQSSTRDENGAS
jgi:hypothetical protein